MKVGDKVKLNSEFPTAEITGKYPGGQAGYKEDSYRVTMAGGALIVSETHFNQIFSIIDPEEEKERGLTI